MCPQSTQYTCSVAGCNKRRKSRGLCNGHYERLRVTGELKPEVPLRRHVSGPPIERFEASVEKSDGCWLWLGAPQSQGYGEMLINGRHYLAHRLSYELFKGPIPEGLEVCHECDNPPCVNPDHLFLGTHRDNMRDMAQKGRAAIAGPAGERHGMSKLTVSDVREIRQRAAIGHSYRQLAEAFGVDSTNISLIVRRKAWKAVK